MKIMIGSCDSTLFTETRSFCLFFGQRVNSSKEEAADGSSTNYRADGAAVHSSVKRKRKIPGDFFIKVNHQGSMITV